MTALDPRPPSSPVGGAGLFTGEIHPLAAKYAMLPDDEMGDLAAHIAENGLEQPCTLDWLGRLVDGRNRVEACRRAGIEPQFVVHPKLTDEKSIARYIRGQNNARRNQTTGQRAATDALCLDAEGKRRKGRWLRGSTKYLGDDKAGEVAIFKAGFILDWAPDLLDQVAVGSLAIEAAYQSAKAVEDEAKREEREAQLQASLLEDLRTHRPDLADLVDAAGLQLADALIIRDKERADELKAQRDLEERRRKFTRDLEGAIHYLAPLSLYPERTAQITGDYDSRHLLLGIDPRTISAARAALDLIETMIRTENAA